jgi:integrase
LQNLSPLDVPNIECGRKYPKYLTENEMNQFFKQLQSNLDAAKKGSDKCRIYTALLHLAMFRIMYTTGLRNFELRTLKIDDIDVDGL